MWQPWPTLPSVQAEAFEARLETNSERCRAPARIGKHEHANGACLAVAQRLERERLGRGRLASQAVDDRRESSSRLTAEKREGDVKALHGPPARELSGAPTAELTRHVVGNFEREEEPDPVTPADGSR